DRLLSFRNQQLPEYVLQNPAVLVIQDFLGRIDPNSGLKDFLSAIWVGGLYCYGLADGELRIKTLFEAKSGVRLIAGQAEGFSILSRLKLQRQNSHADQVRAMNALVAFGNNGAHAQKQRPFRGPVARRT